MCREPVRWVTPAGDEALVHLELRMSSFFGYNSTSDVAATLDTLQYLGAQCHGIMWPAEHATLPDWPVAPPIVAGKVTFIQEHRKSGKEVNNPSGRATLWTSFVV